LDVKFVVIVCTQVKFEDALVAIQPAALLLLSCLLSVVKYQLTFLDQKWQKLPPNPKTHLSPYTSPVHHLCFDIAFLFTLPSALHLTHDHIIDIVFETATKYRNDSYLTSQIQISHSSP